MKRQTSDHGLIIVLVALQYLGLLLVAVLTLPLVVEWHTRDLQIYYESSLKLLQGQFPYRDFPLEYPPLALLPFTLPWLLASGQPVNPAGYVWLFLLQNAILSTLIALVLARVASLCRPGHDRAPALAVYALLVVVSAPLLPWRYDLFPALLTLLALLCLFAGRPTLAGLWIGLGAAAKLYPIMVLPIFGAYYLAGKAPRSLVRLVLGSIGGVAFVLLPYLLVDPGGWISFLRYHQMRGLQLESLPASAIVLAHVLGLTRVELVFDYGALQLASPLADIVLKWQPVVFSLTIGAVIASCLGRFREEHATSGAIAGESLVAYVVLALLAFIATNKVFSAQYIVWLLPFAPLLRARQVVVLVIVCVMTIVIFPFTYGNLLAMQVIPVLLLNVRNILVVALIPWLLMEHLPTSLRAAVAQRRHAMWRRFARQEEL